MSNCLKNNRQFRILSDLKKVQPAAISFAALSKMIVVTVYPAGIVNDDTPEGFLYTHLFDDMEQERVCR